MNFEINDLDRLKGNLQNVVQRGVDELNKGLEHINNGGEKAPVVPQECPYCGAKLDVDSEEPTIVCAYCGTKYDNTKSKTIADSIFEFVEKQQDVAKVEAARKLAKEQEKAAKRARRKKNSIVRNVILLILVVFAFMYYMNFMM